MDPFYMSTHLRKSVKAHIAAVAFVFLSVLMNFFHVLLQFFLINIFRTKATLDIFTDAVVGFHVPFQIKVLFERFPTHLTWKLRFCCCMHNVFVYLQSSFVVESFLAHIAYFCSYF